MVSASQQELSLQRNGQSRGERSQGARTGMSQAPSSWLCLLLPLLPSLAHVCPSAFPQSRGDLSHQVVLKRPVRIQLYNCTFLARFYT